MISNIQVLELLENKESRSSPFPRVDDLSVELDQFRYKKGRRRSNDFPSRPFPSRLHSYIRYLPGNGCCPDCPLRKVTHGRDFKEKNILTWSNVTFGTLICEECAQLHKQMNMKGVTLLSFERDEWTLPRLLATVEGGNLNMLKALGQSNHHSVKRENSKRTLFVSKRNLFSQNPIVAGGDEHCQHEDRTGKNPFSKKKLDDSKRIMDSFKARYVNVDAELYSYHLSKRIMKLCLEFGAKRDSKKEKKPVNSNFCRNQSKISLGMEILDMSDISESNAQSCSQKESMKNEKTRRRYSDSMLSSSREKYVTVDINLSHSKLKNESCLDTDNEDLQRIEKKASNPKKGSTEKLKTDHHLLLRNHHARKISNGRSFSYHFDTKDRNSKVDDKAFDENHPKRRSYSDQFLTMDNKLQSSSHFALVEDMCQDLDRLLR